MNWTYFIKFMLTKRIRATKITTLKEINFSNIQLIFFDVDDTLTNDGQDITNKNYLFLQSIKIPIILLSNGKSGRKKLDSLGLTQKYKAGKPCPKAFLHYCKKFKIKPLHTCIVGDRGVDIATAYFAKCPNRYLIKPYGSKASIALKIIRVIENWKLK